MNIQSINNKGLNVKFGSNNDAKSYVVQDSNGNSVVYVENNKKPQKRGILSGLGAFFVLPVADVLSKGILANKYLASDGKTVLNAPLSLRTAVATRCAAGWGLALAIIGVYDVGKKVIVSNSPKAQKFEQKHPLSSFLTDMVLITIALMAGTNGIEGLKSKFYKKYPKVANNLDVKYTNAILNLDKTKFNKVTLPKLVAKSEKLAQKAPFLAKSGRFLLSNMVLIVFGLGLLGMFSNSQNNNRR